VSADTAQADRDPDYRVTCESDGSPFRVDTERDEISDAMMFGG
jgi:hypothetical protein